MGTPRPPWPGPVWPVPASGGAAVPSWAAASAWAREARSAEAARAASGRGAERIAVISELRGADGGAHGPLTSLACTARVIQARSSTRRSSASATRSSDWL